MSNATDGQKYVITDTDKDMLESVFTYHAPKADQPLRYTEIRERAKIMARVILFACPHSRERSLALTKLEEVVMWANSSIARHE